MAQESIRPMLDRALVLLQQGNPRAALIELDNASKLQEISSDIESLRGLAVSQMGQVQLASKIFKKAIELDPENPNLYFNLAAHHSQLEEKYDAILNAKETLRLNPKHLGAIKLLKKYKVELPEGVTEEGGDHDFDLPEAPELHILKLGPAWTYAGYALIFMAVIANILWFLHPPISLSAPVSAKAQPEINPDRSVFAGVVVCTYTVTAVISFAWMVVDIIDRRRRFSWLLPCFAMSFCGLHGLAVGLYMLYGRKSSY